MLPRCAALSRYGFATSSRKPRVVPEKAEEDDDAIPEVGDDEEDGDGPPEAKRARIHSRGAGAEVRDDVSDHSFAVGPRANGIRSGSMDVGSVGLVTTGDGLLDK